MGNSVFPRQRHTHSLVTAVLNLILLLLFVSTTTFLINNLLMILSNIYMVIIGFMPTYDVSAPDPIYLSASNILYGKGTCVITSTLTVNVCVNTFNPTYHLLYCHPQDITGRWNRLLESFSTMAREPLGQKCFRQLGICHIRCVDNDSVVQYSLILVLYETSPWNDRYKEQLLSSHDWGPRGTI